MRIVLSLSFILLGKSKLLKRVQFYIFPEMKEAAVQRIQPKHCFLEKEKIQTYNETNFNILQHNFSFLLFCSCTWATFLAHFNANYFNIMVRYLGHVLGKPGDIKVCSLDCFATGPCIRHLSWDRHSSHCDKHAISDGA